jgi:type II secretory pathway component PulM
MGKQKLSKSERQAWEKDLATLRAAVAECEQVLAEDDAAEKAVAAARDDATIKAIVARDGASAGFLAIRLMGGKKGGPQQ